MSDHWPTDPPPRPPVPGQEPPGGPDTRSSGQPPPEQWRARSPQQQPSPRPPQRAPHHQPQPPRQQPYRQPPYQPQPYQPQPYQPQPYQSQPGHPQPYQSQPGQPQPYPSQPYQQRPNDQQTHHQHYGPPRYGQAPPPGSPPPAGPPAPRRGRSLPWIAAGVAVVLAAVAGLIIILTNDSGNDEPISDPGPTSPGTSAAGPLTRAYPSMSFTTDPADAAAQQEAQQSAESWVSAMNISDVDTAKQFMCGKDQQITERALLKDIEVGSMEIGDARVRGSDGGVPLRLKTSDGKDISLTAPMVLESGSWKICLG